jgi:hypothetical protein
MSPSPEAAFGAAHSTLAALLAKAGDEHPHQAAREYLEQLVRDGWKFRPHEQPPARPREAAPPSEEYLRAKERLLEQLHAEAMAADTEGATT